jgi:hypothetical protein
MSNRSTRAASAPVSPAPASPPMLPGFEPLAILYEGEQAMYPSEHSAQWALRKLRRKLVEAGAIALLCGRIYVHPQRLAQVVEADAIEAARRRYCEPTS